MLFVMPCTGIDGVCYLVTTRIKNLLDKGTEVELELLGTQESVELLASVACLDGDQVSPVCLEIVSRLLGVACCVFDPLCIEFQAQLCGRLPLCLNVRCRSGVSLKLICYVSSTDRRSAHSDLW